MSIGKKRMPFSIQKLIKEKLKKKHVTPTELARRIGMHPVTIHQMLGRSTMQVDRLWSICVALKVNLFQEIANNLDIEHHNPKVDQQNKEIELLQSEIAELKKQMELLENERNTLKEVIKLINS